MDRHNHPSQRVQTLLLFCSCGLFGYLMHCDQPTDSRTSTIPESTAVEAVAEPETSVHLDDSPIEPLVTIAEPEESTPPPEPQPNRELQVLQQELTATQVQLTRLSAELAAARQDADLAAAQMECLESEVARFDFDLSSVTAIQGERANELVRFRQAAPSRQAQVARLVADFESVQRHQLAQKYQQFASDRQQREATRARLGLPPEDQNEAIRERQRKRAAAKQAETELSALRQQHSDQSAAEEQRLQARVQQVDRLIQRISDRREATLVRLTDARNTFTASQSRIESTQPQVTRLESRRASLLANARASHLH
ncbi:MAG: hypothetical protein JSS49_00660 [Planctomycetes bacterium]|nr:hypothetical protein [Planctomycetota bacterium]